MIYLKNPLCLGMKESEYKEMLALGGMRQKHFEKNEVILSAGCTTHEIGLVLSGSVNIENLDLWGSKSILSNIGAGQVFGETYAFSHETLMVDAVAAPADRYSILESGYSRPHAASRKHLAAKIYPESATDLPAQKSRALPADFLYNPENDPRAAACLSVKPGGKSRQQSF